MTALEDDSPRVTCLEHGGLVGSVPCERRGSQFTRTIEEPTARLPLALWRVDILLPEPLCAPTPSPVEHPLPVPSPWTARPIHSP